MSPTIVEKILANPDEIQLGGENQVVTILFSDIRGFTRMSGHMQPHAVVELLNEYFSEMTDIIFDSGGTLDKYLGDGIMAVYGAPIPKPDDALRATRSAIEMQRSLAALNHNWESRGQPPLRMGVGVNTGPVTAGNIGSAKRMDYTVIGDAVNLASRLCSNAVGGQILVSDSTFMLLNGGIPGQRLDPIRVKGKETPVELHEIYWQELNIKERLRRPRSFECYRNRGSFSAFRPGRLVRISHHGFRKGGALAPPSRGLLILPESRDFGGA